MDIYLCANKHVNIFFYRALISGEKIGIPNKEVIESHAPYYKNLTIEKMFEFAENYGHVFKYFPDKRDIYRLPRQFVINVMATVIKEPFEKWIDEQI